MVAEEELEAEAVVAMEEEDCKDLLEKETTLHLAANGEACTAPLASTHSPVDSKDPQNSTDPPRTN